LSQPKSREKRGEERREGKKERRKRKDLNRREDYIKAGKREELTINGYTGLKSDLLTYIISLPSMAS
jgi:hypothetical protein